MNSANKVSDVFTAAGLAFSTLGKLTMQLHTADSANAGAKWNEDEIEMLRNSVRRFGEDLEKISEHIKDKTVSQIHTGLKKKSFDAAGVPLPRSNTQASPQQNPSTALTSVSQPQQTVVVLPQPSLMTSKPTADFTLNMLNASESEVDVEGLNFEGANEVVNA